ncbi:HAD-superfamily hydrolase, subfamily IA, variant 1 [Colletotrichum zoysiae]|uniref:HAD-superfamily hydrolase, subfamily IA, variant 1 n=1 Tax=Colletotrichum zoysiae TaxID=1216348 RepID=A0AAD9H9G8_9PEZI|nr:HAD-superfamily hydrolase, subfamily IA, variant 1 [Colletotrichum zoysiae]
MSGLILEERLGAMLAEKSWVGFDLDDTLHEFRRASSTAADKVLRAIHSHYGVPLVEFNAQYREILRLSTNNAFMVGKTSPDYRRERFLALARYFQVPLDLDNAFIDELLLIYETNVQHSLELKRGAESLLRALRSYGKKIVIVTEGPQDAQEWTVDNLGIKPYFDFLATTNNLSVSKTDGLLRVVMEELDVTPAQMAFVGDSWDRGMQPAARDGILAFHLVEPEDSDLDRHQPRINALGKLESMHTSHFAQAG